MREFTFHSPTEVVFGRGAQALVCDLVRKYGGKRVLVVYGGGSVERSGLLSELEGLLGASKLAYKLYGGVKPNPIANHVREGVRTALEFGADFILAVGGGSAIDEAKAIAHGTKNPGTDFWDFWSGEAELKTTTPVGVVLTISAAGSETSNSAVVTNEELGRKRGLTTPLNRPCFAIMNPELTFTLPKYQIACGIADIMLHTLERYFTPVDGNRITDEIAEGLLRTVIDCGRAAIGNPSDYDAMSELMWCGSLSHNGLTGLGRPMDFSVHQLGHELSAKYDVSHGASLTTMWGWWAQSCYTADTARFARYARTVWGVTASGGDEAAQAGIACTVNYFTEIGLPVTFSQLGIGVLSGEDVAYLADRCSWSGGRTVGQLKPLGIDGIAGVYGLANH